MNVLQTIFQPITREMLLGTMNQVSNLDRLNGLSSKDKISEKWSPYGQKEVKYLHPETKEIIDVVETYECDDDGDIMCSDAKIISINKQKTL